MAVVCRSLVLPLLFIYHLHLLLEPQFLHQLLHVLLAHSLMAVREQQSWRHRQRDAVCLVGKRRRGKMEWRGGNVRLGVDVEAHL